MTTNEIINQQSNLIRQLMTENNHLKAQLLVNETERTKELAQLERDHAEEVEFLKTVIIAALDRLPAKRVTLFPDSPKDAEFALEPNMSNDMIVILKSIL